MATVSQVSFGVTAHAGDAPFQIKEILTTEGWTTRGSGNGSTLHGDIDSATEVDPGDQGPGGAYDCWSSKADAGEQSWWWGRSPNGDRDVLVTGQDSGGTVREGRVGYTRKGSGGFTGGSTSATVFPGIPSVGADGEAWAIGTRAFDGGFTSNLGSGTAYAVAVADGESWAWWTFYVTTGAADNQAWAGIFTLDAYHPDDPDPAVYGRLRLNTSQPYQFWDWIGGAWRNVGEKTSLWSTGSAVDGLDPVTPLAWEYSSTVIKGTHTSLLRHSNAVDQGDRVTFQDGSVYMCGQVNQELLFLWEDALDLDGITTVDVDGYMTYPEGGGASAGPSAPTLTVVSPSAGSVIQPDQAITLELTDADGLAFRQISVYDPVAGTEEIVIKNGTVRAPYSVTETAITNGYRFVVTRAGGWLRSPVFLADGVDVAGGVL